MDITNVAVAVITGLFAALGSIISARVLNSKNQALLNYRLDKLEEKVDVHNHVIQRVAILEDRIKLFHENDKI